MKKHEVAKKMKGEGEAIERRLKKSDEDYAKGKRHYHPATHSDTQFRKQEKRLGKGSLTTPKGEKNEGEKHYLGPKDNEEQPA